MSKKTTRRRNVPTPPFQVSSLVAANILVGFHLPDWDPLPCDAASGSLEHRLWTDISDKIFVECSNSSLKVAGIVRFDITVVCKPTEDEPLPPVYAVSLAQQIGEALPALLIHPTDQPLAIPIRPFPDWGVMEVSARIQISPIPESLALEKFVLHSSKEKHPDSSEPVSNVKHDPVGNLPTPASALRGLASGLAEDAAIRVSELSSLHYAYLEALAPLIQPVVNARVQWLLRQGSSLSIKRSVASEVNECLKPFGLAIRCEVKNPKNTGKAEIFPAILVADTARESDTTGRFRLQYRDRTGSIRRQVVTDEPPTLTLMPDAFPTIPTPSVSEARLAGTERSDKSVQ